MGRKAGLELADVVNVAIEVADSQGLESATLSEVARRLGIKTPSLYNHVSGLADLRREIAIRGSRMVLEAFDAAVEGREGRDALRELARVDRVFAQQHPGVYESFLPAPSPEEDEELYNEMAAPVFVVAHVLLAMGIPQERALHLVRAMRALLHGFIDLEAKAGFGMPFDIDTSFEIASEVMIEAIVSESGADVRQP